MKTKLPNAYFKILKDLKVKISRAQIKAVITANTQLLAIYFEIGSTIASQETEKGWAPGSSTCSQKTCSRPSQK